jgi:hypothetical protein
MADSRLIHYPPGTPGAAPTGDALIILALLAKKPADRPAGAAALARMLSAVDVEPGDADQAAAWWRDLLPASR